ncbi:MAG TPA: Ig-like domain-containing protein [Caldilineaceae bacterium]|nr:Ig-like domain-containing protein [Caldilineaceae bacterium]
MVTAVEDTRFPTVALWVDVIGANGLPVVGLDAAAFGVQEDGRLAQVQSATPDQSRPLSLVLALDRSTEAANWEQVRAAAAAVAGGLRPEDQIAVLAFADTVETILPFTADKQAAVAAINGVAAGGEFSALNPAVVQAVELAAGVETARRAVVVVADAPDNISELTAEQAAGQIGGRGTPVYLLGFGPRVQTAQEFVALATASGGQAFAVTAAADVQPALATLVEQLRQGYRLEFRSGLAADGQLHTALVQVQTPDGPVQAQAQFTARSGEVVVTLPGLADGQPVAGVVNLTATVASPAPLAGIEYRVGSRVVGAAPDANTPVAWDTSSVTPGEYELAATAVDAAGNEGETSVRLLVVAGMPRLDMVAVESRAFPQVSAFVDVFGANGLPLVGLGAANFSVREDNQAVPAEQVTAQVDASQPLNLVLVLDRSAPAAEWTELRNAVNELLNGMRPQDRTAIYTFAGGVTLIQPPTSDANALRTALAMVEAVPPSGAGADNALHQALLDAATLAQSLPEGRRAVVALTDGRDNMGAPALEQVVATLSEQPSPIHILGIGADFAEAAALAGLAQLTGGNSITVNTAAELRAPLQQLIRYLQQGYRLDYRSTLPADDAAHTLTVALVGAGLEAEATGSFIAQSAPVTVTIPTLVEGATVRGSVDLTAQVQSSSPIVAMVYRLNGEVLAETPNPSYSVLWPSETVEPGSYTIEVTAVDAAGNEGSTTVQVTVEAPIRLSARLAPRNSDGEIFVGDEVTVEAEVDAVAEPARVEVYVDRVLVGADDRAPFAVRFDSSELAAGAHRITVVATDVEGHEARAELEMALTALPLPEPTATPQPAPFTVERVQAVNWGLWAGYLGVGLVLLAVMAVLLGLARVLSRTGQQQRLTPMRLALTNLGNVATGYLLRGDDPAGALTFRFTYNGVVLGMPPVARFDREPEAMTAGAGVAATGPARRPGMPSLPGMPSGMSLPQGAGGMNLENAGSMMDRLDEASAVGRIIADILITISYFLPANLARPVRSVVTQIRRGQMLARRVQHVRRQFDRLNQTELGSTLVQNTTETATQMGRAATSEATREALYSTGRAATTTMAGAAGAAAAGAGRSVNKLYDLTAAASTRAPLASGAKPNGAPAAGVAATTGAGMAAGSRQWVYLPPLKPGETATIEVLVGCSQRLTRSQHFPFRLISRALGQEQAQPVIEEGSIRLEGIGWWRRYLWVAVLFALLVAAAAVIGLLAAGLF